MYNAKLLARIVGHLWLAYLGTLVVGPVRATEPTVGDGRFDISVRSVHLLPEETLGGRMATIVSYSSDHSYYKPPIDWLPPSEAQTFASVILGSSPIPIADLMLETTYENIPIEAHVSFSSQIQYKFVAYNKIGLDLPADQRVPLIMSGYVSASSTNLTKWDFAYADSTVMTEDGSTFSITAWNKSSPYVTMHERAYVRPDFVNSVTLSVSGNIGFSGGEPLSGSKGLQALADPNIFVDPDYMLTSDGSTYRASDVYGLAFSPGFMVPEPSTLVILGIMSTLGGLLYTWQGRRCARELLPPERE